MSENKKPPFQKQASLILRKGKLHVHAMSRAVTWLTIGDGPITTVDPNDIGNVGKAVIAAIAYSRDNIPHPKDQNAWKEVQRPMLEAAGVKSWDTLMKGAKNVGVYLEEGRLKIQPTLEYSNKHANPPTPPPLYCSLDPIDVGNAIFEAISLST